MRHEAPYSEVYTIAAPGRAEFVVERSRFLGFAEPVKGLEAAKRRQEELRREFPGASHVAYAARLRDGEVYRDDREPPDSAGLPLLRLLRARGLLEAGVFVVRYFGGKKLGLPRLRQAYAQAGEEALLRATTQLFVPVEVLRLTYPWEEASRVHRVLRTFGLSGDETDAASGRPTLVVAVPCPRVAAFLEELAAATRGRVELKRHEASSETS